MTGKWVSTIPSGDKMAPLESRGSLNNNPLKEFKLYGALKQVHTMQDFVTWNWHHMSVVLKWERSYLQKDKHGKLSEWIADPFLHK